MPLRKENITTSNKLSVVIETVLFHAKTHIFFKTIHIDSRMSSPDFKKIVFDILITI